jgi:hypothetical protein
LRALGWFRRRSGASEPDPVPVDGYEVLEKVAKLPVSTWHYVWDPPGIYHLGPMAQDFAAAFRLGDDDTTINLIDANGVLTVALQALYRKVRALETEVSALKSDSV